MNYSESFIEFAINKGVIQFGKFTLKSGRVSPYFFNAGLFNDGESLEKLSGYYSQAIIDSKIEFDMLFGPAYKGIPLVSTVSMTLAGNHQVNVPYSFNRKEVKKYGDGGQIVGAELRGRVLIIDDVITAGTAIYEAVNIIKDSKAEPAGVVIAFDRQERGKTDSISAVNEVENKTGIKVISVAGASDLVRYANSKQLYADHLPKLEEYFKQFSINTI